SAGVIGLAMRIGTRSAQLSSIGIDAIPRPSGRIGLGGTLGGAVHRRDSSADGNHSPVGVRAWWYGRVSHACVSRSAENLALLDIRQDLITPARPLLITRSACPIDKPGHVLPAIDAGVRQA